MRDSYPTDAGFLAQGCSFLLHECILPHKFVLLATDACFVAVRVGTSLMSGYGLLLIENCRRDLRSESPFFCFQRYWDQRRAADTCPPFFWLLTSAHVFFSYSLITLDFQILVKRWIMAGLQVVISEYPSLIHRIIEE